MHATDDEPDSPQGNGDEPFAAPSPSKAPRSAPAPPVGATAASALRQLASKSATNALQQVQARMQAARGLVHGAAPVGAAQQPQQPLRGSAVFAAGNPAASQPFAAGTIAALRAASAAGHGAVSTGAVAAARAAANAAARGPAGAAGARPDGAAAAARPTSAAKLSVAAKPFAAAPAQQAAPAAANPGLAPTAAAFKPAAAGAAVGPKPLAHAKPAAPVSEEMDEMAKLKEELQRKEMEINLIKQGMTAAQAATRVKNAYEAAQRRQDADRRSVVVQGVNPQATDQVLAAHFRWARWRCVHPFLAHALDE